MKELIFELTVDDVKSSMKTDDTLPMVGEFDHDGRTVRWIPSGGHVPEDREQTD